MPNTPRPSDTYVQSFARGLAVIQAFGPGCQRMTLTEVAKKTKLTRAGARRILLTLQTLGFMQLDGRLFSMTTKIRELGDACMPAGEGVMSSTEPTERRERDGWKVGAMSDAVRDILGRPNFACAHVAEALRATGDEIGFRSESEQAAVLHFLLGHWIESGDKWPEAAQAAITDRLRAAAAAKDPA